MAVSANQLISRQAGEKIRYPVAASTHIYQGTLVFEAGGYADDDTATGANPFVGVAIAEADNSSGANGAVDVEVWAEGVFELVGSGFAQTDVGSLVYASDNYTVTTTSTSNSIIGRIVEFVSATKVRVKIETVIDQ